MGRVEYKDALYRRELRIDCIKITLTQNTDNNPLRYSGNGYIHQQQDGALYLHMYASASDENAVHALLHTTANANLMSRDKYFSLRAIAYGGDEWTCDSIRAQPEAYGCDLIIRGRLHEIRRIENSNDGNNPFFLEVQIFQELGIEHTSFVTTSHDFGSASERRFSTFRTRFGRCESRSLGDRFFWQVSSQNAMPTNLHDLGVFALEFLAAKVVVPRVIEYHRRAEKMLRLLSPRLISERTRLRRPISSHHLIDYEMPWRLFSCYLEYLASYPGSGWHPCVLHLHNALDASANSIDAARLGLCVAVEGLASLIPTAEDEEERKVEKKLNKTMRCVLKRSGLTGTILGRRAEGLLNQLNNPRLQDRLETLAQAGVIRRTLIKTWSALRHGAAHAAAFDIDSANPEETQKLLAAIDKVTTLMYEIMFYLIGYDEEYTDYSESDQPPRRLNTGTVFESDDPRANRYRPRPLKLGS